MSPRLDLQPRSLCLNSLQEKESTAYEQPDTPMRTSSSSRTSACLKTQYSDDGDLIEDQSRVTQPAAGSLGKQHLLEQEKHEQWAAARQAAAVSAACLAWIMISSATILINKHIMVDLSFHFPAAVSALGMAGTTVASFLACKVFRLVQCKATVSPYFFFTRIMTTGFLIALSFQAGNTAYLYLSVAFVQMLKAFTPVSTMLYGFAFGLEKPSAKLIAAVSCISCGVLISSYGELNFSMFGVAAMLTSIAAEGLRTVLMQQMLASKQFHPLEAWVYLGPACIIWLMVLVGVVEAREMLDQGALAIVTSHKWYFVFASLAGFAVNALAMLVIKMASALTLKVLGLCKDVGLVVFGVLLLGEHVAGLQVGGYSVSLCGFAAYNYIKGIPAAAPKLELPRSSSTSKGKAVTRQHSVVYISASGGHTTLTPTSSTSSTSSIASSTNISSNGSSCRSMVLQQQQYLAGGSGSPMAQLPSLMEPLLPRGAPLLKTH